MFLYWGKQFSVETIAWAVAIEGRSSPQYRGEIANRPNKVLKLVERLNQEFGGEVLLSCCEAGPCGYQLEIQLHRCIGKSRKRLLSVLCVVPAVPDTTLGDACLNICTST